MIENIGDLNPIILTIIATLFTWLMTTIGASTVFITKNIGRKLINSSLGFAAGAMIFVVVEDIIPDVKAERIQIWLHYLLLLVFY